MAWDYGPECLVDSVLEHLVERNASLLLLRTIDGGEVTC